MSESSIHFTCPSCGTKLRSRAKHIGKWSVCPCGAKCKVPDHHGSTKSVVITVQDPGVVEFFVQPVERYQITPLGMVALSIALLLVAGTLLWVALK